MAAVVSGCSSMGKKPPGIASVTVTDKVDEKSMAPQNSVSRFSKDVNRLFVAVLVTNPQKGTVAEVQWYFQKPGETDWQAFDKAKVTFDAKTRDRYAAFSLEAAAGFSPGSYKAEILLNGKSERAVSFAIE